jgi:competence protein ComEC
MSNSKIFIISCLSLFSGIFLGSFIIFPKIIIFELFFLGFFYLLIFKKNRKIIAFSLFLIFFALGLMRINFDQKFLSENFKTNNNSKYFLNFKEKIQTMINKNIPYPESSLLSALILGNKENLDFELKENLSKTGLSHLVAISGFHLAIFSIYLSQYLIKIGFWRKTANILTIILSWLYIFLVGLPASAVRAGIMITIFLLAQELGRLAIGERVILYTALIMLLINPLLLRFDIGFQLSFLAVLGIIYYKDFFEKKLNQIKILEKIKINEILATTLSAQVFIFPLLIFYFKNFPLLFIFTNILTLPIFPILMFSGIFFLILSLILPFFSLIFAFPTIVFLKYFLFIVNFFSKIKFSSIKIELNPLFLLPTYLFLLLITVYLRKKLEFEKLILKV